MPVQFFDMPPEQISHRGLVALNRSPEQLAIGVQSVRRGRL
jgi:hypothetical protein